jgi:exosortase/archaeosortase family protein
MFKRKKGLKREKRDIFRYKDKGLLKVTVLFSLLVVSSNVLVWFLGRGGYLSFFEIFNAKVAGGLIFLSGLKAEVAGNTLWLKNETWLINTECTAIFVMAIFASFILVYPSHLKEKTMALLLGIPAIFLANMLRLLAMAWLSQIRPAYSPYFHDYLWQVVFILLVIVLWLVWIEVMVSRERKNSISC